MPSRVHTSMTLPHESYRLIIPILVSWLVVISGCAGSESFTTRPGFTEYFEKYPPNPHLPNQWQHALLEQYKPRIYRAGNQQGPIDFYKQYVANGVLKIDGRKIAEPVNADKLNYHRNNAKAQFGYQGEVSPGGPAVIYARYDEDTISYEGAKYRLQFLTYNLVFPVSGMLQGLGKLSSLALTITANLTDWHQLDHYVGLSVVLYQQQPVAVMLQQHNYQTTYVVEHNLSLPADGRVQVDIAMRSNELYLHNPERIKHPAVSFTNAGNIAFLLSGTKKPFMAGFDVTHGEKEIDYQLEVLPQTDAFYQFKGHLGKSRLLPGRDGPPGADYATLPALMPRATRLVTGFRTDSQHREIEKISALFNPQTFTINESAIDAYKQDFFNAAFGVLR